jgi:hypothetical protein
MEHSEAFERDIEDVEATAIALVEAEEDGESMAHNDYLAALDHVINTYPVPTDAVRDHAERVASIHRNNPESTASQRISTQHEAFMDEVCEDYDPTF